MQHQTQRALATIADNVVTLTHDGAGGWFVRRTYPDGRTVNVTEGVSTFTYARLVFVETVDRLTKGL